MRMDLLIDIGNTSAKIAVAEPIRDSNQSSEVGIVCQNHGMWLSPV